MERNSLFSAVTITANGVLANVSSMDDLGLGSSSSSRNETNSTKAEHQFSGEPQYSESTTNHFWTIVEKGLVTKIPNYVKNLMSMVGFDNHISVRRLNTEDISEMESFGRDDAKHFIDPQMDLSKIYNIYSHRPDHFKILPGHKRLIEAIRDYVASKPHEHFANPKRFYGNRPSNSHSNNANEIITANSEFGNRIPANGDLMEEKRQLERLISSWLNSNVPSNLLQEAISVEVSLSSSPNDSMNDCGVNTPSRGLTGGVKCPLCQSQVKVGTSSTKSGRRWIISNFVRHVRGHYPKDSAEHYQKDNAEEMMARNDSEIITVWPEFANLSGSNSKDDLGPKRSSDGEETITSNIVSIKKAKNH